MLQGRVALHIRTVELREGLISGAVISPEPNDFPNVPDAGRLLALRRSHA